MWRADPVHPQQGFYSKLAKVVHGRPDGEHQRQEEASDEGHGMQVNEGPEWIHRSAERDHLGRARGRWRGGRDGGGGSFLGGDRQGRYD